MMHAVLADMLSPAQAEQQVALIQQLLQAPDGHGCLTPIPYAGGVSTRFQRRDGRLLWPRIGVMYMDAHLRWCQTLAHLGRAGLLGRVAVRPSPSASPRRVPASSRRQAIELLLPTLPSPTAMASLGYAAALAGEVPPMAAGASIPAARHRARPGAAAFAGRAAGHDAVLLDPVLLASLDGLEVSVRLGHRLRAAATAWGRWGHGVRRVLADDGLPVRLRGAHAYRTGAFGGRAA